VSHPPAETPTASALVYLFADRIVPLANSLHKNTPVPCRDVEVQSDALAKLLLASSFWSLREQSAIGLELSKRKWFLFNSTRVRVRRLKSADRPGLEGAIIRNLSGAEDDVRDTIFRWAGSDDADPCHQVVQVAVDEAVLGSFIDRLEIAHQADERREPAKAPLRPRCEEIASLEERFQRFVSSWETFGRRESALCRYLVRECANGISACIERYYA
jgi:hypothetical protein